MKQSTFNLIISFIFAVFGTVHFFRLLMGIHVMIGGWLVPLWVSGVAVPIAFGVMFMANQLAYKAKKEGK